MIRIVVGGVGRNARFAERYLDYEKVSIVAYVDNDENKWYKARKVNGSEIQVFPLDKLEAVPFDYILVTMAENEGFLKQLSGGGGYLGRVIILFGESEENQNLLKKIMVHNFWLQPHKYQIGNYFIDLGESMLQRYQHSFPMFDAVIGVIAQALTANSKDWIVDIGANVGDTLFMMMQYTAANILAVEPTDKYYQLLSKNVAEAGICDRKIILENSFISWNEGKHYVSEASNGTAAMVYNPDEKEDRIRSISIVNLLAEKGIGFEDIRFIKCDTDGYDADCLMSCGDGLRTGDIWLYWENQLLPDCSNYEKFNSLYAYLDEMGYQRFYVFDNYGNFLGEGGVELCYSINGYLKRNNNGWSQTTFHYVDILGCKSEKGVGQMISEYLDKYQ